MLTRAGAPLERGGAGLATPQAGARLSAPTVGAAARAARDHPFGCTGLRILAAQVLLRY